MMAVLARIILLAASAAAFVARPSLAPVGARARSVAPQQFVRSRAPVALPSRCVAAPILAGPRARPLPRPRRRDPEDNRRRPRRNVAMSLFGLGPPELAVCLGIAAFVLGRGRCAPKPTPAGDPSLPPPRRPEKLGSMAKDFGKVAGELKDVPKEFKEGLDSVEPASSKKAIDAPPIDAESK